ncbi:hypothetical protein JG688_00017654 [Phytophthora aleatoria]|uniref:Uncharacterized protein n=1 Tax=Phytophthora aleatoria TaxID=2496075 RepID=A0A8J5LYE3_9STRA|nr:hypothetical protein JG688_00017654 [Phytophthora aleatoria]
MQSEQEKCLHERGERGYLVEQRPPRAQQQLDSTELENLLGYWELSPLESSQVYR